MTISIGGWVGGISLPGRGRPRGDDDEEPPPTEYIGPGDLATFRSWGGLRAYSAAAAVGEVDAIRVRRDDTDAETDIAVRPDGSLDVDSAATFADGADLYIVTYYDQTGNGEHFGPQSDEAKQELLILDDGDGNPAAYAHGTAINYGVSGGPLGTGGNMSVPFCYSMVAKRVGDFTTDSVLMSGQAALFYFNNGADAVGIYNGDLFTSAASDGDWHALHALFNGASSAIVVDDNSPTTDDDGGAGTNEMRYGRTSGNQNHKTRERGYLNTDASADFAALAANQTIYWGI